MFCYSKTELVCWCVFNQNLLWNREYFMIKFYEELTVYMKMIFDRDIKHVKWVFNHLISNHHKYQTALLIDFKVICLKTDLTQTLNVWIEFIDDLKNLKTQRIKEENKKQAHQCVIVKQQQTNLMTHQSTQKQFWNEDNSSENDDLDEETETEEEDSSSICKKQLKNSQLHKIALLNENLKFILSLFEFDIKKAASIFTLSAAENVFKHQKKEIREELNQMKKHLSDKFDEMLKLLCEWEKKQ